MNTSSHQLSPIEDPILDTQVSLLRLVLSLVPVHLDLMNQAIASFFGSLLHILTLLFQVGLKGFGIPFVVRARDLVVPVLLDDIL